MSIISNKLYEQKNQVAFFEGGPECKVQQIASRLLNAVWKKLGTKRRMWEDIRVYLLDISLIQWKRY
jgi:hypothetical protein